MAEEYEKRVPVFDYSTGDFKFDNVGRIVTVTQSEAVEQIAQKAQITARGVYEIYSNLENEEDNDTYGTDIYEVLRATDLNKEALYSELQRAIREAIIYDIWVTDVSDIVITEHPDQGNALNVSYTIEHIFGETYIEEVLNNG